MNNKKLLLGLFIFSLVLTLIFSPHNDSAESGEMKEVIIGLETPEDVAAVRAHGFEVDKQFEIIDAVTARMPAERVSALAAERGIRYIEENREVYALSPGLPVTGQDVPWGVDRVFGEEEYEFPTWDQTRGEGIPVGVLDTGIDEEHEDLPELSGGVTTVDDTHWGQDDNGHGTMVAGVISSLDNDLGVVGVAPESELYSIKVLDEDGSGPVSAIIEGIEWAVEEDIPVLNLSLGMLDYSESLEEATSEAYAEGHLLIGASGNDGEDDNVNYPAAYDSVMAVSASDEGDDLADFSDTGEEVELIAPGEDITTTAPDDSYAAGSGTSFAAPHVSGIAALLKSADSGLSHTQIRNVLQDTAEDLGLADSEQGYGLSRADEAVAEISEIDPEVADVEIVSGEETALIPAEGENIFAYEAEVYDQQGNVMEDEEVNWSLEDRSEMNLEYVEMDGGELTVQHEAEEDGIKVTATSVTDEEIYDEKEVELEYDFELLSGKLRIVNRRDSHKLSLTADIYTEPVEGERLEEIVIEDHADHDFVEFVEDDGDIIFDFTELQLENRSGEELTEIEFILKDEERGELARLSVGID